MKNEIEKYNEAIEIADKHNKINAYDDPYLKTSEMSDVYRIVQWIGRKPDYIHKGRGYRWIVGWGGFKSILDFSDVVIKEIKL